MRLKYKSIFVCTLKLPHFTETRLQSRLAQLQIGFSLYDKVPDGSKSQPELSFCLISTTTHFWSALKHTTYYKTSATLQFVSSTSQFSFTPWSKKYHNNSITKQIGSTTNRFQFLLWSTWWFQISTRAQFLLDLNHNSLLVRTQTHHILQNLIHSSMRLKYKSIFVCTLKLPHFTETRLQSRLAQLQIGFKHTTFYYKVPDGSKSQPELSFY